MPLRRTTSRRMRWSTPTSPRGPFAAQTAPKPADPTSFTLELNARLAAVEQIKAFHDQEIRRLRRIRRLTFAASLLLGGAMAAFLILHPVRMPDAPAVMESPWFWPVSIAATLLAVGVPMLLTRRITPTRFLR